MTLLLDVCRPCEWEGYLTAHGLECRLWLNIGNPAAPDSEIMAWAKEHRCIVITNDLDFGRLLAFSSDRFPRVVQFRAPDIRPSAMGRHLLAALQDHSEVLETGALVTVDPDRTRIRILPF